MLWNYVNLLLMAARIGARKEGRNGGEKNKFKHLGIIKNGTTYTAQGARKKKTIQPLL
jgi:hypothetical protein